MLESGRNLALACTLSAVAGYVDSIGFLHLGGLFVSFMSGNSTRLGVSVAQGHWQNAAEASGLIVLFVVGAAAAFCYAFGLSNIAIATIVLAMGLENAVFQIDGGAGLGLTYVTGTLVKVGQLVAAALAGGARWGWLPNLLLWAALVAGAVAGAYRWINLSAIWFAAGTALALSGISAFLTRFDRR
jgi:uncharacterized membrane protein YoaK (UPF0700 family)